MSPATSLRGTNKELPLSTESVGLFAGSGRAVGTETKQWDGRLCRALGFPPMKRGHVLS